MKEFFTENGIEFKYVDITGSMANLRDFLKYRDTYAEYEEVKARGAVGVPSTVINDGERIIIGNVTLADVQ